MSKNTKKVFWGFLLFDYKAINEYLEKMAQEGWLLQKVGKFTAKFEAIDPQNMKFYVGVFPGSTLHGDNNQELIDYRNLCEESGWIFMDDYNQLQIFRSHLDEPTPVPIQTDEEIEQKIAESKIFKHEMLPFILLLIFHLLLSRSDSFNPFQVEYNNLLTFSGLLNVVLFPYIILFNIILIVLIGTWIFRTRRSLRRGGSLPIPNVKFARIRGRWFYFSLLFIAVIFFLSLILDIIYAPFIGIIVLIPVSIGFAGGLIIRKHIKKHGLNNKKNVFFVAVSMVIIMTVGIGAVIFGMINVSFFITHETELPQGYKVMKLEDFYDGNSIVRHRDFDNGKSPIVPNHYDYYEISKEGSIRIEYYQVIHSYFAKIIFDGIVEENDGDVIVTDSKDWDAEKVVFLDNTKTVLILKNNEVVMLNGDFDFSDSNTRDIVLSKLF